MKTFLDSDFLLHSDTARALYHEHAAQQPIIDYHCHLNPKEIADNHAFADLTEAWLGGDHYKWRAMRANGIDEAYITGDKPSMEKFLKWAATVPYTMRNPLYHWTHLELKRFFGCGLILGPDTVDEIWELTSAMLEDPSMSVRNLIRKSRVKVICTTERGYKKRY